MPCEEEMGKGREEEDRGGSVAAAWQPKGEKKGPGNQNGWSLYGIATGGKVAQPWAGEV